VKDEASIDLDVCGECGAAGSPTAAACWLCGSTAPRQTSPAVGPAVEPDTRTFSLTTVFVVIALAALFAGLFFESPGVAVMLVIVAAPALVATLAVSARRSASGRPLTTSEKVAKFFLSLAVVLAVSGLLMVAAVAALFVWCLYAMSNMNFH